jgi:hypothetical protein
MRWGIRARMQWGDPDVMMVGKRQQRFVAVVDDDAAVRRATRDPERLLRLVEDALRAR